VSLIFIIDLQFNILGFRFIDRLRRDRVAYFR